MIRRTILIGLLAVASLGATGAPVAAKSGDVIARGQCSGSSVWKLKLSPEDGRIEVEFEVDQNRNDHLWRVSLTQNGTTVWRGTRYTRAPSGLGRDHPCRHRRRPPGGTEWGSSDSLRVGRT